jgi:hypothetical protein
MDWRKVVSAQADSEKILRLVKEEGLTVSQLTERFNMTAVKIREIIRKGGISLGSRRGPKKRGNLARNG